MNVHIGVLSAGAPKLFSTSQSWAPTHPHTYIKTAR